MYLIIGLGNPGKKYKNTRHNAGVLVVQNLQKDFDFPDFKLNKKMKVLVSQDFFDNKKIILVLPQVFMNESGKVVENLISNTQYPCLAGRQAISNLWIVHDDIDLPLGKIKISKGKSSAGHKGVQSLIDNLKTKDFIRFRIGIGTKTKPKNVERFVLENFTKEEKEILKKVIKKTIELIKISLEQGLEKAQSVSDHLTI